MNSEQERELIEDKEGFKRQADAERAAELIRMKAEKEKEYFPSPEDKERQMKLPPKKEDSEQNHKNLR